jgi:hypothetical protein
VIGRIAQGEQDALGSDPGALRSREDLAEVAAGGRLGLRERGDRSWSLIHRFIHHSNVVIPRSYAFHA